MVDMRYSNVQRIGFAGLIIGFMLCIAGAIAPYWRKGEVSAGSILETIDMNLPGLDDVKLVTFHGGLFYFCVETVTGDKTCEGYDRDNIEGQEVVMYILLLVQTILSMLCGCCGLCRMCCCGGGKTVCHGVMAFLAGGAGLAVVAIYCNTSESNWGIKLTMPDYGWALAIYAIGAGMIVVVSFMLCFASPDNPITGMILSHAPGAGAVVVNTSQYSRFDNNVNVSPPPVQPVYPPPSQPMYPPNSQPMYPMAADNAY